jgi:hypothetical protein
MLAQIFWGSKWLCALGAAVGFLSSMNSQMSLKAMRMSKRRFTLRTAKQFFASMNF